MASTFETSACEAIAGYLTLPPDWRSCPFCFLTNALIAGAFRLFLPKYFLERNPLIDMVKTRRDLLFFLCSALYAGGFKEELQRAFILTRFREHLGGVRAGLVIWSLAFGAGHYVQGLQGIVVASLYGMLFGVTVHRPRKPGRPDRGSRSL